jgi:hypothetical protein
MSTEAKHLAEGLEIYFTNPEHGWFQAFVTAVSGLTAEQAARVPAERFNSVWAVVNHVRYWTDFMRLRMLGEKVNPEDLGGNDGWPLPADPPTEEAWQAAVAAAVTAVQTAAAVVAKFTAKELNSAPAEGWPIRAQVVQGMLAHNSYHTCEIISIRHMQGLWLEHT